VQDSDEMAVVSLCLADDNRRRDTGRPLDIDAAAAVIAHHVTPLHEKYCKLNLRLHSEECESPRWSEAEAEADQLIAAILASRRHLPRRPGFGQIKWTSSASGSDSSINFVVCPAGYSEKNNGGQLWPGITLVIHGEFMLNDFTWA